MLLRDYLPKSCLEVKSTQVLKPRFPVLDIHAHFGELLMGPNYADLYDTDKVVADLRACGIEKIVNLDLGFGDARGKMLDKLKGYEDFFINFGTVDVQRFEEPGFEKMVYQSLTDGVKNYGMAGIKLWKPIGLGYKDSKGNYLRPDDARIKCIFETAAELKIPVLFHIADPVAFFYPIDRFNERYEELGEHPDWGFSAPELYSFQELMQMQENLIASNPDTTFIIAHFGSYSENLARVGQWLDAYPNMYVDIAARISELGRQPYTARKFLQKYSDRILFGTDQSPLEAPCHPTYYRFLETDDEYFSATGSEEVIGQGRWNIYGIYLDDESLQNIYYKNAKKILGL